MYLISISFFWEKKGPWYNLSLNLHPKRDTDFELSAITTWPYFHLKTIDLIWQIWYCIKFYWYLIELLLQKVIPKWFKIFFDVMITKKIIDFENWLIIFLFFSRVLYWCPFFVEWYWGNFTLSLYNPFSWSANQLIAISTKGDFDYGRKWINILGKIFNINILILIVM